MKLLLVVGTRPNFIKAAPLWRAMTRFNAAGGEIKPVLVHTGQHYDPQLNGQLFQSLALPQPDHFLGIGSGSHAEQVGRAMMALEPIVQELRPHWTVAVGDVNAALATALVTKKLGLKLAHVEAGLRSHDWGMPEETNRLLVDRVSDLLLATTEGAVENLRSEGAEPERIALVGNIMIDTLEFFRSAAESLPIPMPAGQPFGVATLHRPANVDDPAQLRRLCDLLKQVAQRLPVLFPVHPRTRARLRAEELEEPLRAAGIQLLEPFDYPMMLACLLRARVALTDSGGIQEEACVVGLPCLTLRTTTERPETLRVHGGTSDLIPDPATGLLPALDAALARPRAPRRPPLWDGRTADRILDLLWARRDDAPWRGA